MSSTGFPASPRADLAGALAWIALGALIVAASWRMERLTEQGATLHTMPGLWPGIVGALLTLMGVALAVRSLRRAARAGWKAAEPDATAYAPLPRFLIGAGLFLVYALLLVGRGLPFWLGTALFVAGFVWLFQLAQRRAEGRLARGAAVALACGALTAIAVTLLFEKAFYVRLP